MASDVRYTFAHRLPTQSHSIHQLPSSAAPAGSTSRNPQPFTVSVSAAGGPSPHCISRLALDERGPSSSNLSGFSRAPASGSSSSRTYDFPPTYTDHATLARMKRAQLDGILDEGGQRPAAEGQARWSWNDEDILVRSSLQPTHPNAFPLGIGDDPLPSEQHPSYPFGRPNKPRPASSHPRASLPNVVQSSRAFQNEAAAWNGIGSYGSAAGSGAGNAGGHAASASDGGGAAGTAIEGLVSETAGEASNEAVTRPLTTLPAYLERLKATAIAASTASPGAQGSGMPRGGWPFARLGPGRSLVRTRAEDEEEEVVGGAAAAARELWLERDFAALLPKGRERDPLEYLPLRYQSHQTPLTDEAGEDKSLQAMLDAAEADLAARAAADAAAASNRGEPAEVRSAESEATAHLRLLFSGQAEGAASRQRDASASDENSDSAGEGSGSPTRESANKERRRGRRHGGKATSSSRQKLPALLLDPFGGDAEELRDLLASSSTYTLSQAGRRKASTSASTPHQRDRTAAEDEEQGGVQSRWAMRARQAAIEGLRPGISSSAATTNLARA